MRGIDGKSIVVTGGAQGLGEGIVRRLADAGARVVVADLNGDKAEALAAELRTAMERRAPQLAAKPAEFYAGEIIRMDGQPVTRLEMLQLIKEHELTHRQQLFMYLRLNGVVPPTTRRRQAKAKA